MIYGRVIFIVTFLATANKVWPEVCDTDWFKTANMCLFAFSNGHCASMAAVYAPRKVENHLKEGVGTFIGVTTTAGVTLGSFLSIGMIALVPAKV